MIDRRQFSQMLFGAPYLLSAGATVAAASNSLAEHHSDILIGGGQYIDLNTNEKNYVLSLTTPFSQPFGLIPTEFYPHGFAINPDSPNRVVVMEKKGPGCCLVDIESQQVIEKLAASPGSWFYGHGAYNTDGSHLFIVETRLDSKQGLLSVRDGKTNKILDVLDTHGANPHDCRLVDNGRILAITNAGLELNSNASIAAPCVTYLDALTGQLLEKVELTNKEFNAGHLLVSDDLDLAVVSAPREGYATTELGGVSLRPKDGEMLSMLSPIEITEQLIGETLSLAYHKASATLAATTPDADLITFWNMNKQSFIAAVKVAKPRGICLTTDQTKFIVSSGESASLYSIDTNDLSNVSIASQGSYISGSHLMNWSRETH